MSTWDQRVRGHAIWDELKKFGMQIDRALERDVTDFEWTAGLERLRAVLALAGKRLAVADPTLVDPRSLDAINISMSQASAELDAYVSDGNSVHITSANARADEILSHLGSIPNPISADDLTIISEAAASYRKSVEAHFAGALAKQIALDAAIATSSSKITALEAALTAEQQRLATLATEQQTQFSTAQDKRASDFSTTQTDQQTKFATLNSDQQTAFSTDQDTRKTAFSDTTRENQEKFVLLISDYTQKLKEQNTDFTEKFGLENDRRQTELDTLKTTYEDTASAILEEIRGHKAEVQDLVGVIGNLGVTSGYLKVANHARLMLYIWQALTMLALTGLIGVATLVAFPHISDGMQGTEAPIVQMNKGNARSDVAASAKEEIKSEVAVSAQPHAGVASDSAFYQGFITRLFLSITFGVFAAYAARQASSFRESEQKNRRRALELEALGPFIEPLDKETKDKFRVQIGERSFAVPDNDPPKPKDDEPVTALALLKSKELGEIISNIVKAVKP